MYLLEDDSAAFDFVVVCTFNRFMIHWTTKNPTTILRELKVGNDRIRLSAQERCGNQFNSFLLGQAGVFRAAVRAIRQKSFFGLPILLVYVLFAKSAITMAVCRITDITD